MFIFSFKYRMKRMLRDRKSLMWTLIFPICLGTFFFLGLSNVSKPDFYIKSKIAIVENDEYINDKDFKKVIETVTEEEKPLFEATVTSKEEAEDLLDQGKITGYIELIDGPKLIIKENGVSQSIIKTFLDQYERRLESLNHIFSIEPNIDVQKLLEDVSENTSYITKESTGNTDFNILTNYFYALLAMSCLFASSNGAREVMDIQADLSKTGARINVAPIQKLTLFLSGICAALVIQMIAFCIVLAYITLALKINLGSRTGYILLTGFISTWVGVSLGAFVAAVIKGGENLRESIFVTVAVGGSFLSGLMLYNMKYIVVTYCPIISYINPSSLITDAFYSLYYYETFSRYYLNIGILCIELIILWIGTYMVIRRKRYASI